MQGISVIIPVLNREDYIGEAIDSVLAQEYVGPLEIIISDDGSSDRSISIAESYGNPVRVLKYPKGARHSAAAARNRGLKVAQYPLLAFLDSDDIYLPGHLSNSDRFLTEHMNVVMAINEAYGMSADGNNRWKVEYPRFGVIPPEMILLDPFFPLNAVVVRNTVFSDPKINGYFNEELRLGEDVDLWLRIAENYIVATHQGGGVAYREHGSRSISDKLATYIHADIVFNNAIKRHPYPGKFVRKRKAAIAYRLAGGYFQKRIILSSVCLLLKAAFLDPLRALSTLLDSCWKIIRNTLIPKPKHTKHLS